ncbi:MAG: MoxR family ATPase [Candidatus Altiarchaeota archaeon]|nr:MoxR family ATPase [Candidatus Altiarchaeota archaeon]
MPEKEDSRIKIDKDVYQQFSRLYDEIRKRIVGYDDVVQCILISLLCDGHVLLESVPGMGKTMLAKTLSETLACDFKRIQGTADLTSEQITGKVVYDEAANKYVLQKGPVFTNILLMDEINRAPPMSQSALLEVMEEKKATIAGTTYELPKPFIVLATENPLEQKGVFPLPEAQKDRFLFKVIMMYLTKEQETAIIKTKFREDRINKILNPAEILILRKEAQESVEISDSVMEYAVRIVEETRNRKELQTGASPRASIAFVKTAKAKAFLEGRDNVTAADIKKLAYPILRHRVILNPEFVEMRVTADQIIKKILDKIEVPLM